MARTSRIECKAIPLVVLLVFAGASRASAAVNAWSSSGPDGGPIVALAVDPTNADVAYARAQCDQRVFKTSDGGVSWRPLHVHSPEILEPGCSRQTATYDSAWAVLERATEVLLIDPLSPSTLYVLIAGGVFRSDDAGENWTAAGGGLVGPVESLIIDPLNSSTVYAAGGGGVFKTLDAGATWFPADNGLPEERTRLALAIDDANPAVLYAASGHNRESRLFRSTDGGESWSEIQITPEALQELPQVPVQLLVTPGTETLHLLGARYFWRSLQFELLRSDDAGHSWRTTVWSCDDSTYPSVTRLIAHPALETTLYAITADDKIVKTINAGLNWSDCVSHDGVWFGETATLAASPTEPSILYAARIDGVYRSEDDGLNWVGASGGLTSAATTSVAIAPEKPDIVYAETPAGVVKSSDGARSWASPVLVDGRSLGGDLAVDHSPVPLVYAAREGGLFRSDDSGESWTNVLPWIGWHTRTIAVAPSLPGTVYVGERDSDGTALRSSDGATTWTTLLGLPDGEVVVDLAIDPLSSRTIYAATELHLMKSSDLGQSWEAIHKGLPKHWFGEFNVAVGSVAVDPFTSGIVHAGTPYGLFTTVNGGQSWTGTALAEGVKHIAFDPGTPGRVYALTDRGVQESRDNGQTWSLLNRGLPEGVVVRSFAIGHGASRTLHAATDFGVFSISRVDDGSCAGDCDGDARVGINELNVLVAAFLVGREVPGCGFADPIRVGDLVAAVRTALDGCNSD